MSATGMVLTSEREPRSICICIDDFGLHDGVNLASLELRRQGRVQALSCMTGAPAWHSGAAALRKEYADPVDLGLHIDLTEHPLTVPAAGSWSSVWMQGALHRMSDAQLRIEIGAQLDEFEAHVDDMPDFIDGHQHVHQFPQVRDALVDVLLKRYPYRRPWVRSTRARGWQLKQRVIQQLGGDSLTAEADLLNIAHNRRLLGVYDFSGGPERYETLLGEWFGKAKHGDLLMCHPSALPIPGDEIAQARLDEYEVLAAPGLPALAQTHGLRLRPMSLILAERRAGQGIRQQW